ncbi:hypothetical protein SLEP1_g5707 [Rubroshorea leprosula]|uniref:Uncharacterized protein n=1 Tax=Rubroshorea leprosula TaxID=152421 RepID=A0AAV5HSU0_9ROSI|nr:hypothetical protein SLEP1_g5707 [Rubroshorea leprosula]
MDSSTHSHGNDETGFIGSSRRDEENGDILLQEGKVMMVKY